MNSAAPSPSARPLWLALFVLAGTMIGGCAGLLAAAGGANVPTAILTGGATFAGAIGLLLAVSHFLARTQS
jgi:hypothetical protein